MSVAWVSLDENENDLAHFWHYIYTALEQATGERFSFSVQNAFYSGKSRYIVDYLLEEVIDRQPEAIQTFLLSTALLDRLCGPLCASILHAQIEQEEQSLDANRSAQEMLEQLESSHLFLD